MWFLGSLTSANTAWVYTLGLCLTSLWVGALVHMLVAFPTGRVERGIERWGEGGDRRAWRSAEETRQLHVVPGLADEREHGVGVHPRPVPDVALGRSARAHARGVPDGAGRARSRALGGGRRLGDVG